MDHEPPVPPSQRGARRRWLRRGVVAFGAAAAALLLAEGVCRLLRDPWIRPDLSPFLMEDPLLGWRHRPGSEGLVRGADFEARVRYDQEGSRALPGEPGPGPDVVLLGDSFLDGYMVDEDDHLAARLQEHLRRERPGLTLHNLGTVGYSTDQELLQYELWSRTHAADLVLLFFHDNDVAGNGLGRARLGPKPRFQRREESWELLPPAAEDRRVGATEGGGVRAWLRGHSALHRRVMALVRGRPSWQGRAVRWGWMRPVGDPLVPVEGRLVPAEYLLYLTRPPAEVAAWWEVTEALLTRLRDACRREGSALLVVRIPIRAELDPGLWQDICTAHALDAEDASADRGRERLTEVCRTLDLPLLDARGALSAEAGPGPWLPIDGHWSAQGHAAVAAWLADRLGPALAALEDAP